MTNQEHNKKRWNGMAGNSIFFGLLLLLLFHTGAKAWFLQQLMAIGLFKPETKKEAAAAPTGPVAFSFRDEQGRVLSTGDLKGQVVFINFWVTWCPPCIAEMPALNDLYHQFRNEERIVFLFINEDEDSAKATAFLDKNRYGMPLVVRTGAVPAAIYSGTLPTTVVLDKEGKLVFRKEALAKYDTPGFIKQLKALL